MKCSDRCRIAYNNIVSHYSSLLLSTLLSISIASLFEVACPGYLILSYILYVPDSLSKIDKRLGDILLTLNNPDLKSRCNMADIF